MSTKLRHSVAFRLGRELELEYRIIDRMAICGVSILARKLLDTEMRTLNKVYSLHVVSEVDEYAERLIILTFLERHLDRQTRLSAGSKDIDSYPITR